MNLQKILFVAAVLASSGLAQAQLATSNWSNGSSLGNALSVSGNSSNVATATFATPFSGEQLFISATFTVAAGSVLSNNDFLSLWLDNGVSNADHTNVPNFGIKSDLAGGNDLFVRTTGTAGSALAGSNITNAASGGNYSFTLVGLLAKTAGSSTYNSFSAWLNPGTVLGAAAATFVGNSGLASISRIGLRSANLDAGDGVSVSGLLFGSSFAQVSPVPEPSTYAMLLAGLGLLGFMVRRRTGA